MRLPLRKKFVPETECVPAFFFNGEKLVEVAFTEFSTDQDGNWQLTKGVDLYLPESTDNIIFETPVGCFEIRGDKHPGSVFLRPSGAGVPGGREMAFDLCHRTREARAKLAAQGEVPGVAS